MGGHLAVGHGRFPHPENGVIATARSQLGAEDFAAADALGFQHRGARGIGQGHGAVETGAAVGGRPQLLEQAIDALGVGGRVARRIQPWSPAEAIHFQAGIVGQGPLAGEAGHGFRLEAGIGQVGVARFLDVQGVRLAADLQINGIQHGGDFSHLVGVATGNHQNGSGQAG